MRAVLEEARDARPRARLWLEVLVQNEPAIRLYEKLGFAKVRELEVWTLDRLEAGAHGASGVRAAQAHARIRGGRT